MSFSEEIKSKVKKKAHFRCCMCHSLGVEIHHILPISEGGPDVEENAAPLCPSCHETYGANTTKRKLIRDMRDFWYEICEKRFTLDAEQLDVISTKLDSVATKEDIARLSIQSSTYILGKNTQLPCEHLRYSFFREEFIHPLILRELMGWLSDSAEAIISVDLTVANRSNRFFGDFAVRKESEKIWVEWGGDHGEYFVYSYIATSPSGVHMLECYDSGGGSGIFGTVALLSFDCDRSLVEHNECGISTRERILLKTLGSVFLGDRYNGKIEYRDGLLIIGPDDGWSKRGEEAYREIPIR